MRSQPNKIFGHRLVWPVLLGLLILATPGLVLAGPFTRLQVLLPGETAAPGTPTGKTGVPDAQVVGVPFAVTIRACDDDWQTTSEITDTVAWNASDAGADLPPNAALAQGTLTADVTLRAAGTFTISGQDLSAPGVPPAYSANVVAVVLAGFEFAAIDQREQTAGAPFPVAITAVDPGGNPVAGYSGPVDLDGLTSFGPGRIAPAAVTLDQGTWNGQVRLYRADETNPEQGNVTISVTLPSDADITGTSEPFVVHPGQLSRVQIVVPGQWRAPGSVSGVTGTPASQSSGQAFTVDLYSTDEYWNLLPSTDVINVTSNDPGASTPVAASLVDGEGQASLYLAGVGAQSLTVNNLSNPALQGMTSAPIFVNAGFADHFAFEDLPPTVTAGAVTVATIYAKDESGQTITTFNGDANLWASTGQGTIAPNSITFDAGVWTGIVRLYAAAGAVQITCSDYATEPHQGQSGSVQVLPGPYTATQVIMPGQSARNGTNDGIVGQPDELHAGVPFTVQVRAVDQYFNRVPAINNALIFDTVDENMEVPDGVRFSDGEATFPITLFVSGYQTMRVSDAVSQGIDAPSTSSFMVAPGPYTKLLLLAPGESGRPGEPEGRLGTATDQSITYEFTVIGLAADQWYNQVGGITDLVHLSSTDPAAELAPDQPMVQGRVFLPVRLATGGYQQITLASVSTPAVTPSTTQVRAISSGLHLEAGIVESVTQAGLPFTVHVDMVNDAGSIIQEINSEVQVTVRNANTGDPGRGTLSPSSFQLLQGQRSLALSYTFAEPIILEISDQSGSTPALTGVLNVEPGAPNRLALGSDPHWLRANRTAILSATISDAHGNPIPGQTVTFATTEADQGSLSELGAEADDKSVVSLTDDTGVARAEYHSPRQSQVAQISAGSGQMTVAIELATALVDPNAAGGHITSYPNPFHPDETNATIAYVLDTDASVRVRGYTVSGGLILDRQYAAGDVGGSTGLNEIQWDGRNGDGEPVASGGYIFTVEAAGNGATQHVMRRKIGVVW